MVEEFTAQEIWSRIRKECQKRLSQQTISTWLSPSRAVSVLDESLTVELRNKFTAYYVEQNYQKTLDKVAGELLDRPFKINFIYREGEEQMDLWAFGNGDENMSELETNPTKPEPPEPAGYTRKTLSAINTKNLKGTLNPRYTFDTFVVGRNNQFAHAAAKSVAESPANRYNPLFIFGGVGLGKTHLMQAIGHALLEKGKFNNPKICYISAEEFLNKLIRAITSGSTVSFRNRYRRMDILLIDDVEFLAKKEGTQEEFFHTFNTLYESQKQIVLTSDRPPREIHHLEERLRSRFQWGLVADIQPPELETRIAILKKKSALEKILIPEKVLSFIAESITGNVRLLEGSLHYLKHYSSTQKTDINLELAEQVLKNLFDSEVSHISVGDILKVVSDDYAMPINAILSLKRKKSFVEPRQVAMYLCNKLTKLSLPETAEQFKRKDHTTVMHACRKIARICEEDVDFKLKVGGMIDKLKNHKLTL